MRCVGHHEERVKTDCRKDRGQHTRELDEEAKTEIAMGRQYKNVSEEGCPAQPQVGVLRKREGGH